MLFTWPISKSDYCCVLNNRRNLVHKLSDCFMCSKFKLYEILVAVTKYLIPYSCILLASCFHSACPLTVSSSGHCSLPGALLRHLPHQGVPAAEDPRGASEDHADSHARNHRAWRVSWSQPRPVPQLLFQSIIPGGRRGGATRRQRKEPGGAEKWRILSWRGWQSVNIKEEGRRERSVSSPQNVLVCVAAAGSVFLALISARPGQEYIWIWSQIFRLLKVRLIRLIRRLKKSLKSGKITCKSWWVKCFL